MEQQNTKKQKLELEEMFKKKGEFIIRALNHPLRRKMLRLIHGHGRITVKEIYYQLRLGQSEASFHLSILRMARIVVAEKVGRSSYYAVDYNRMAYVQALIKELPGASGK